MTGTKSAETPVMNARTRNHWDIEGKLWPDDKWGLCGRYFSLAAAEEGFAGFEARAGTTQGDCLFYGYVRLMAPRRVEPLRELAVEPYSRSGGFEA